jgi:transposase-like protein
MVGTRRSAEKEAFWRLALDEHRASGQSVRAFCKQESLSEASLYAWRKELERRDRVQEAGENCGSQQPPAMIPVSVVGEVAQVESSHVSSTASPASACSLEVLTPSGFTLRFDHHIEPAKLRVLLQAVASCGDSALPC